MCSRLRLFSSKEDITKELQVDIADDLVTRHNITPNDCIVAIIQDHRKSKPFMIFFRWGLIPSWAKDPAIGFKLINARAERASEKPSIRYAFKYRRCLILTNGFYEWHKSKCSKTNKQPYFIGLKNESIFGFA